jgi:hypothetical protein
MINSSIPGKLILITLSAFLVESCGNNNESTAEEKVVTVSDTGAAANKTKKEESAVQKVFYALPSPIETADLLKKAGATYNKDYLNSIDNFTKYNSNGSKAMNLGVYGTDLSFTTIFDVSSESLLYLKRVNGLASGLGIADAFGEGTMNRMQSNSNNRDSLLAIISDAYWTADAFLQENQRPATSALIVTGGWVEGLYLATRIAKSKPNDEINQRIAEQKLSLDNLLGLLKDQKSDADVAALMDDLQTLKVLFLRIKTSEGESTANTDDKTKVTTIGGGTKFEVTQEEIEAITRKVDLIRTKMVNKS